MQINRKWCMPNKNTFDIKPIKQNCKGEIKSCSKLSDGTKLIWKYYKEEI